jgi:transformation/transcription domain-associated protein
LTLSSAIIQHGPDLLAAFRKEVVRAGWNLHHGAEEPIVRHCASIYLCRFYDAFESPPKFVMSTLQSLIKTQSTEYRNLTKQALDVLVPTLPKRLADDSNWARLIRKMLTEDLSQFNLVYGLINRHRDVFYPHRALFVPHMMSCFQRNGHPGAPPDWKSLCLDLADVILYWERKARAEPLVDGKTVWLMPVQSRNNLLTFLINLMLQSVPPEPAQPMALKQMELLQTRALSVLTEPSAPEGWPDVKLQYLAKSLSLVSTGNFGNPSADTA